MKKISTWVLTVLSVFALGTLTSCKDDCEDRINDLRSELLNQNSTLRELLEAQKADLQGQISALKSQLDGIKSCTCDPNAIQGLNEQIQNLQNDLTGVIENGANKSDIEAINNSIADLQNQINGMNPGSGCTCDLTEINNTLTQLKNALDNKADKEALETLNSKLTADLTALDQRVAALEAAKTVIENDIVKINETITTIQQTLDGKITNIEQTILVIQNDITTIKEDCKAATDLLQKQIDDLKNRLNNLTPGGVYDDTAVWESINKLQTTVESLNTTVESLQTTINGIVTDLGTVKGKLTTAEATINTLEAWIEKMKGLYGDDLETLVNTGSGGSCSCDIEALKREIENCKKDAIKASNAYTDEAVKNLVTETTLETKIKELKDAYEAADKALQEQITTLEGRVDGLEGRVSDVETKVDKLTGLYDAIVNRLNSQISSIIVQSVTTPLFLDANISLPFNVQSNIICAYYGSVENGATDFPSSSKAFNLSDDEDILTDEEIENFDIDETHYYQGDPLISSGGKVYLTINPSNVDFTGAGLKLVDSQNGNSGFTLDNVKPSNKKLSFVSRAADNGFYEADVTLVDKDLAAFPTAPLKDAAKEVYDLVKTHTGIRDMATAVVKAAYKSVNLPAYAVQAPYTYKDENGNDVTAYVHSNYNIAATAIHPLTYNFSGKLGDYASKIPHKKFRHISYISDMLIKSKAWKDIKTKLYFEFDDVNYITWTNVTVDDIKFEDATDYITIIAEYKQPTKVNTSTGEVTEWKDETLPVVIKGSDLNNMVYVINDAIQNDMVAKLNNQFSEVQVDFVDAVNAALKNTAEMINTSAKEIEEIIESLVGNSDKYVDRVNNLIDKVNNQLLNVYDRLDNIDYYLLPIMFYRNAQGDLRQMGSYESTAGYVNAGYMVLYPTSYTAEILNPAAKKMIKVTKAKDLKTGVNVAAEVDAANKSFDNLNKVIDGNVRAVGVQLKSGYAYEIAYSALDYTGYQVTQRYWVKVK